jgi:hypothetical protein
MAAQIVQFTSRRTQLRLREARQVARFVNRYGQYVPPTPEEEEQLRQEQLEHKRQDLEWSQRHGSTEGCGGGVIAFRSDRDVMELSPSGLAEGRQKS